MNKEKNQIKVGEVPFEKIVEGFLKVKPPKKKRRNKSKARKVR